MNDKAVFTSPRIYYEIEASENSFDINVYLEGFSESCDTSVHCRIENFCEDFCKAERFVEAVASSCALPVHIKELAEEFLSI